MTRTYSDAIDADELARQFYDEPTPEPREIPAGKILLSEYADVDDTNRARHAELETVRTTLRELRISHTSAGYRARRQRRAMDERVLRRPMVRRRRKQARTAHPHARGG